MKIHGTFKSEAKRVGFRSWNMLFLLGFCSGAISVSGQAPRSCSGIVIDNTTGEALSFATVVLENGLHSGTSANEKGLFTLHGIPSDTSCLLVSFIGFSQARFCLTPEMDISNLSIGLDPIAQMISSAEIIGERDDIMQVERDEVSLVTMSPEKIEYLPNIGTRDIMRSFQLMPGVSGSNEASSNLYVRGGTPDQNLVLYDGFTVYQVDHLYGFFSAFNADAIKDVRLYKGGFGAKYGGRLSSVTQITGKDGNRKEIDVGGGISLLGFQGYTEIPIGSKLTFLAAGRRSYQGPIYNKIFDQFNEEEEAASAPSSRFSDADAQNTVASNFYDLNAKLTFQPTQKQSFSISFFNGEDKLDNGFESDTPSALADRDISIDFSTSDLTNYGNFGIGGSWSKQWDIGLYSNTSLGYSNYYSDRDRSTAGVITMGEGESREINNGTFENNDLRDLTFRNEWLWDLSTRHTLEFGLSATYFDIAYSYAQNDTITILDRRDFGMVSGLFLEDKIKTLDGKLTVTPGLRLAHFDRTNDFYPQPRLSAVGTLSDNWTVKLATGLYYQFANRITREDILEGSRDFWILSDGDDIPVSAATHFVLGASYENDNYLFSAEGFFKPLRDLSEYSLRFDVNTPQSGQGITYEENFFNGNGTAKGIELLAQKKFGRLTGWIGYTLSEVNYEFEIYSDEPYPANHDVTHEFKTVGMYEMGNWTFAATMVYATGKPYTAPSGAYEITLLDGTTQEYFTVTSKNSLRLPAYHRLDLSANYRLVNKSTSKEWGAIGMSLFNVYDRKNVWYKEFEIVEGEIVETDIAFLGLTPNVSLRLNLR